MEIKVNTILAHDWWKLDDERRANGLGPAKAVLSDEHAMSCYGIPVLVLPDGRVIGPGTVVGEDGIGRDLKLTQGEYTAVRTVTSETLLDPETEADS